MTEDFFSAEKISGSTDELQSTNAPKLGTKYTQNKVLGLITFILLIVGGLVGIYLGQNQQDPRQRAAEESAYPVLCNGAIGPCANTFAGNVCFDGAGREGSCVRDSMEFEQGPCSCLLVNICCRKSDISYLITSEQACKHQYFGSLVDDSYCQTERCSSELPTASACFGNEVDSRCTDFSGTCRKTTETNGKIQCACIADTNPTATSNPQPTQTPAQPPAGPTEIAQQSTPIPTATFPPGFTPSPTLIVATLPPGVTQEIGLLCVDVALNNLSELNANRLVANTSEPKTGNLITLTCSTVAGANRYEFRMKQPDLSYQNIPSSLTFPNTSVEYQIPGSGTYTAECRPCVNSDPNSCADWPI